MLAQAGALLGVKRASRSFVEQVSGVPFLLLYACVFDFFRKLGLQHFFRHCLFLAFRLGETAEAKKLTGDRVLPRVTKLTDESREMRFF